ncbi:hypothetical protein BCCH1_21930 [Burkholderia contaminans]|uniref:Uncharacterized protein n=1 Tax=Burkholderia contaminans TaxID=488447 RepID=A0A250L5C4_9BURK|nr:hypothetical protein BCCH1_21930 [Burkholderia contaminans]
MPDAPVGNCSVNGARLKFEPGGFDGLSAIAVACWRAAAAGLAGSSPPHADRHATDKTATTHGMILFFMVSLSLMVRGWAPRCWITFSF